MSLNWKNGDRRRFSIKKLLTLCLCLYIFTSSVVNAVVLWWLHHNAFCFTLAR